MRLAMWAGGVVVVAMVWSPISSPGAGPASAPATQRADLSDRLTFLTLQLSSTEESIKAINLALRGAGYKAAVAAERAADAEKGNELMDRKGGAPVPWDQFYGRTARDFIAPIRPGTRISIKARGQVVYPTNDPIRRPAQMDYIYRANNEQAAKARTDAAALGKKIDALLARRRQLEAEQSALWATISWESIQNREIPFRSLYRFKLKQEKAAPAARLEILRAGIVFLRSTDGQIDDERDVVAAHQDEAIRSLKDAVVSSQASLQQHLADAMLADLDATDVNLTRELLAVSKRIASACSNMGDARRLALDGDAAGDDARKLRFQGALQESLLDFSEEFGRMDDLIMKIAETWNVVGEKGVASEDKLPVREKKSPQAEAGVAANAVPAINPANPPAAVAKDMELLFDGKTLAGWEGDLSKWSVVDGAICGKNSDKSQTLLITRNVYGDFRLQVAFKLISGNSGVIFRRNEDGKRGYQADIFPTDGKLLVGPRFVFRPDAALQKKAYHENDWNTYIIEARGEFVRIWVNDQLLVDCQHKGPGPGRIGLELYGPTEIYFRDLRIKVLP